jgi:hypothetical protein
LRDGGFTPVAGDGGIDAEIGRLGIVGQRRVAIACQDGERWRRLVKHLGSPGRATDAAPETLAAVSHARLAPEPGAVPD